MGHRLERALPSYTAVDRRSDQRRQEHLVRDPRLAPSQGRGRGRWWATVPAVCPRFAPRLGNMAEAPVRPRGGRGWSPDAEEAPANHADWADDPSKPTPAQRAAAAADKAVEEITNSGYHYWCASK